MNHNKAAILSLALLSVVAIDSVSPLVQKINASYPQIDPLIIKQTITLPSTIAIIFVLLSGQLVRFLSKKTILIIGLILYGIGGIGAGWAKDFSIHLLLRGLVGAGMGLISPIQTSLVADFFHGEERVKMFGNCMAVSKSFAIIVPPLAAWIGAYNWRYAFNINILSFIVLIFILIMLDVPSTEKNTIQEKKNSSDIPGIVFLYAFFTFMIMVLFSILLTDLTYLINTKGGISSMISAYGLSATTVGTMLAGMAFSRLYKKLKKWIVPMGLLFFGFGFLAVVHSMSNLWILSGLLWIGFGIGCLTSLITLSSTNAVGERDSTSANSVVNCAFSIGIAFSPFLFARIPILFKGLTSVESNFKLVGLVFLCSGLISLFLCLLHRRKLLSKSTI
ncbi:MAG: MFS transporter [Anaerolineaceae bacterium]